MSSDMATLKSCYANADSNERRISHASNRSIRINLPMYQHFFVLHAQAWSNQPCIHRLHCQAVSAFAMTPLSQMHQGTVLVSGQLEVQGSQVPTDQCGRCLGLCQAYIALNGLSTHRSTCARLMITKLRPSVAHVGRLIFSRHTTIVTC